MLTITLLAAIASLAAAETDCDVLNTGFAHLPPSSEDGPYGTFESFPECCFSAGVYCGLRGGEVRVVALEFMETSVGLNAIEGTLPAEIDKLNFLSWLNINGQEKVTGGIPEGVCGTSPQVLWLVNLPGMSGTIPGCVFTDMPSLQAIDISGTPFEVSLPQNLATVMPSLMEIILSQNETKLANYDGLFPDLTALPKFSLLGVVTAAYPAADEISLIGVFPDVRHTFDANNTKLPRDFYACAVIPSNLCRLADVPLSAYFFPQPEDPAREQNTCDAHELPVCTEDFLTLVAAARAIDEAADPTGFQTAVDAAKAQAKLDIDTEITRVSGLTEQELADEKTLKAEAIAAAIYEALTPYQKIKFDCNGDEKCLLEAAIVNCAGDDTCIAVVNCGEDAVCVAAAECGGNGADGPAKVERECKRRATLSLEERAAEDVKTKEYQDILAACAEDQACLDAAAVVEADRLAAKATSDCDGNAVCLAILVCEVVDDEGRLNPVCVATAKCDGREICLAIIACADSEGTQDPVCVAAAECAGDGICLAILDCEVNADGTKDPMCVAVAQCAGNSECERRAKLTPEQRAAEDLLTPEEVAIKLCDSDATCLAAIGTAGATACAGSDDGISEIECYANSVAACAGNEICLAAQNVQALSQTSAARPSFAAPGILTVFLLVLAVL